MRQKVRRIIILITFLLFPIVMNYLSPYVPIAAAAEGIVTMSLVIFTALFLSALLLGRAWCAWVCPISCLQDICSTINGKRVNIKRLKIIRYIVFTIWVSVLIAMFVLAGGVKGINLLFFTENGISVDMPVKYIIYYGVLALLVILNLTIGKRGSCHAICWMSPFMTAGFNLGKLLKLPQLRVRAENEKCINCGACDKKCPMSLNVSNLVKSGKINLSECILCGECIDVCPKKVLHMGMK